MSAGPSAARAIAIAGLPLIGASSNFGMRSLGGYWKPKLARNVERDASAISQLTAAGWSVFVIWECETEDRKNLTEQLKSFLG
jgi:G:T-mismatch repair DNA endonuclease (very short patch repair protein)